MTYTLDFINEQVRRDPKGFIEQAESRFHEQIERTAVQLAERREERPIVLLNGPSSSGKTTTAGLLGQALTRHGIGTQVISMDNYYRTHTEYIIPKDDEGVDDLESPECMDLPMLLDHLQRLAIGETIEIPQFDFERQCRTEEFQAVRLAPDQIAVIEGIHSLSDAITGGLEGKATGLYLSVASAVEMPDGTVLTPDMLRFIRRAIRDRNFRGAPVDSTLYQWRSVCRGEKLYIAPYRHYANMEIDSYLPYETNILMQMLAPDLQGREQQLERLGLLPVLQAADLFVPAIYQPYLPENSVLHEFIG